MRLALVGATGKMGRAVARLALEEEITIVCAISPEGVGLDVGQLAGVSLSGTLVTEDLAAIPLTKPDVVIDFSSANAFPAVCAASLAANAALVSGTTGLTDAHREALADIAQSVPVLWEPNMSLGVHVLGRLVEQALSLLGDDFDVEIIEAHHKFKVDAPSGTALRLLEVLKRGREDALAVNGREGQPGTRGQTEVGMHAIRGGDVIGDHTVMFLGSGERIELTHRATSRDLFAKGALVAAQWIQRKAPGRYSLRDVVG